jgi:hypothetical protein
MNAFKFSCPACGQRIQTEASEIGRPTDCPACKATIVIPSPTEQPEKPPPAVTAIPVELAEPPQSNSSISPSTFGSVPTDPATREHHPSPANPPEGESSATDMVSELAFVESVSESAASADAPPGIQVAVLTPEIKREIVQAAREQIADASRWMLEVKGGSGFAYAGKFVDGKLMEVPATNPEATHFSLFGAVLREFDGRNVTAIATGRKEFLDDELPEAIQEVLRGNASGAPASGQDRPPLTHAQCLAVLGVLDARYARDIEVAQTATVGRKLVLVRLEDLVSKLENEAPLKPEEVATALYHELSEIRERLTKLEQASRAGNQSRPTRD